MVKEAKSVISLSFNYYPEKPQKKDTYKIAKYAYGEDYHHVLKSKLNDVVKEVKIMTNIYIKSILSDKYVLLSIKYPFFEEFYYSNISGLV